MSPLYDRDSIMYNPCEAARVPSTTVYKNDLGQTDTRRRAADLAGSVLMYVTRQVKARNEVDAYPKSF